jgi:stage II sporulation protein E
MKFSFERIKALAPKVGAFVGGILMGSANVFGTVSPFGAAYAAAAPRGYAALSVLGALIGCIFFGIGGGFLKNDILRNSAAVVAVAGIRWALSEQRRISRHPAFKPIAAMAGTVLTGAVISYSIGAKVSYDLLLYVTEGLLAAAGAYFISKAFGCFGKERKYALPKEEITALLITASIMFISICRLTVFGFSVGTAAVLFAMLCAARKMRELGGAVAGITAGAIVAISGGDFRLAGICAIAGLLSGVFSHLGSIAISVSALSVCGLSAFATGSFNIYFLGEMLLAAVVFSLVPEHKINSLLIKTGFHKDKVTSGTLSGEAIARRIEDAASALLGVSETVEKVSGKLSKYSGDNLSQVYRLATEKLCTQCGKSEQCWKIARDSTQESLNKTEAVLLGKGVLTLEDLPAEFKNRCVRSCDLTDEINLCYADYSARQGAKRRISQVRSVVGDQLGGVSIMLTELAEEIAASEICDTKAAKAVAAAIHGCGYTPESVLCSRNNCGGLEITAKIGDRRSGAIPRSEIIYEMENALDMPLSEPVITGSAEFTIKAVQLPNLDIEFGVSQHCCDGERLCGDSYEAFLDDGGYAVMMISDGMGTGGRAAVDSAMTCGLTGKLLRAGFGFDGAMRIVNSSLLVKSDDESLATADITKINLYTGEADLCKAGAVQTYIRMGRNVRCIMPETLPLGILREVEFAKEHEYLAAGDIIVMISDGVNLDKEVIERTILEFEGEEIRKLTDEILMKAGGIDEENFSDDMTVLAARLVNG